MLNFLYVEPCVLYNVSFDPHFKVILLEREHVDYREGVLSYGKVGNAILWAMSNNMWAVREWANSKITKILIFVPLAPWIQISISWRFVKGTSKTLRNYAKAICKAIEGEKYCEKKT